MTDLELITSASAGDPAACALALDRFRGVAYAIARDYYLPGSDIDDVRQEATIGIWKAIRSWQSGRGASPKSFVILCVRRHLISCVKVSNRRRAEALTSSVRTVRDEDGELGEAVDQLEQFGGDPLDIAITREQLRELADDLRVQLSPLEARCLLLWGNGLDYAQIHALVGLSWKSVDRAITRARWKLRDTGPPSALGRSRRIVSPATRACSSCGLRTGAGSKLSPRPEVCNVCSLRAAA